jgi:hypothetical protein
MRAGGCRPGRLASGGADGSSHSSQRGPNRREGAPPPRCVAASGRARAPPAGSARRPGGDPAPTGRNALPPPGAPAPPAGDALTAGVQEAPCAGGPAPPRGEGVAQPRNRRSSRRGGRCPRWGGVSRRLQLSSTRSQTGSPRRAERAGPVQVFCPTFRRSSPRCTCGTSGFPRTIRPCFPYIPAGSSWSTEAPIDPPDDDPRTVEPPAPTRKRGAR